MCRWGCSTTNTVSIINSRPTISLPYVAYDVEGIAMCSGYDRTIHPPHIYYAPPNTSLPRIQSQNTMNRYNTRDDGHLVGNPRINHGDLNTPVFQFEA